MMKLFQTIVISFRDDAGQGRNERRRFIPEPPPGFVRRSDPNFYFLARKF